MALEQLVEITQTLQVEAVEQILALVEVELHKRNRIQELVVRV
jgi:hypothetical protein